MLSQFLPSLKELLHALLGPTNRNAHGILLIYDITSKSSFDNVRGWIRSIEEHSTKGVRVTLVGNKADMDAHRVISKEQGQQLASEFRVPFFETSAKADINVDDIFVCIARESKRLYDETHSLNAEKPTCVNLQGATVPAQVISSPVVLRIVGRCVTNLAR
ncbi:hypothetical protein CLOP_g20174 [Closterium sp. NIES-67]|nr:hypothetical protein CLOP_g20174 [Closterium sp. NIES-67]